VNRLIVARKERVRTRILWIRGHFCALANSTTIKAIMLGIFSIGESSLVSCVDLALNFLLLSLDISLKIKGFARELILFKFNQSFFFDCGEKLFIHLIDALGKILMLVLNSLDVVRNDDFLTINTILVLLVEITLLPKLLPSTFSTFSNNFSLGELNLHALKFSLHTRILVLNVCDQANAEILEGALFLKFEPLILENVHGFLHVHRSEEITDEIIDNYFPFNCLCLHIACDSSWNGRFHTTKRNGCGSRLHTAILSSLYSGSLFSMVLKRVEVIKVVLTILTCIISFQFIEVSFIFLCCFCLTDHTLELVVIAFIV